MAKKNKTKKVEEEAVETEEEVVEEAATVEEDDEEEEEKPPLPDEGEELMYAEVRGDNYHEYRAVVLKQRNLTVDLELYPVSGSNAVQGQRNKVKPFDPAVKCGWWRKAAPAP